MTDQKVTARDILEYLGHMTPKQLFGLANRARKSGFNTAQAVKEARAALEAKGYNTGYEAGLVAGKEIGSDAEAEINVAERQRLEEKIQKLQAHLANHKNAMEVTVSSARRTAFAWGVLAGLAGAIVVSVVALYLP